MITWNQACAAVAKHKTIYFNSNLEPVIPTHGQWFVELDYYGQQNLSEGGLVEYVGEGWIIYEGGDELRRPHGVVLICQNQSAPAKPKTHTLTDTGRIMISGFVSIFAKPELQQALRAQLIEEAETNAWFPDQGDDVVIVLDGNETISGRVETLNIDSHCFVRIA